MSSFRVVAIGASAGGVEPLLKITRSLPADLPAAVFVVLHVPPNSPSVLPTLISRGGKLEAVHPQQGEELKQGRIYVAPPDLHLIVRDGRVHLGRGPAENGSRPAIDPLFRSLADGYGAAAIGVVLSGALDDGTGGLHAIKAVGGITVVQDPEEALYPSMPKSALEHVAIDHVVACAEIPGLIARLVAEPLAAVSVITHSAPDSEIDVTEGGIDLGDPPQAGPGQPSSFACPDCHGVLWEIKDGALTRFRCRVGHAYLPESLAAAQSSKLEEALWTAMRTLRESASLAERLAARANVRKMPNIASAHEQRAADARERARVIEAVLKKGKITAE